MFSIRTRRRVVVGLIVLVYASILAFVPLVLWPRMKTNGADIATLEAGSANLKTWTEAMADGTLEETAARVEAQERLLAEAKAAYSEITDYYRPRDQILDRMDLLNRERPDTFKLDYLSLAEHWNAIGRRRYGRYGGESIVVSPTYDWVQEPDKAPSKTDYDVITKTTCVLDAVIRLLATGEDGGFVVTSVTAGEPEAVDPGLSEERAKAFSAPRYNVWPVTAVCEVPFSANYRDSIERVISAPAYTAKAPTRVSRHPTTGVYLPEKDQAYYMPVVRLRSVSFEPLEINWATVTVQLDVYDFEWED